jgi:hypothetical protein
MYPERSTLSPEARRYVPKYSAHPQSHAASGGGGGVLQQPPPPKRAPLQMNKKDYVKDLAQFGELVASCI